MEFVKKETFPSSVQLVILFGSHARGFAREASDIDIAVVADHSLGLAERSEIGSLVAQALGVSEDRIDLVDVWNASPLLQFQIANTGEVLYGDSYRFIRFKVLAWKRYQDTAKFRRAREESLKKYFGKS